MTNQAVLLAAWLVAAGTTNALANQRTALLVGNSKYVKLPALSSPTHDVRLIAATLGEMQFKTKVVEDASLDVIARAIDAFLGELQSGDAGLFYYAGRAVQYSGDNYLIPVGYDPASREEIDYQSYSLLRILREMEKKNLAPAVIVLDASYASPALAKRYPDPGLTQVEVRNRETVVAFSALPGQVVKATDGQKAGLYAQTISQVLKQPALPVDRLFAEVRRLVNEGSRGEQMPSVNSTVVREFLFNAKAPQMVAWEPIANSRDIAVLEDFRRKFPGDPLADEALKKIEALAWERVKDSRDPAALRAFRDKYPSSPFAAEAVKAAQMFEQSAVKQAVFDVLRKYREAYEGKNLATIKQLWPSVNSRLFEQSFSFARSIKMDLSPVGDPQLSGNTAVVMCQRQIQMRTAQGAAPPVKDTVAVKLQRMGEGWVIDSIQ